MELINQISIIVIAFVGLLLAFWVHRQDRTKKINQTFFLLTILALFWISFSYLGHLFTDGLLSLIFKRLNFATLFPFFLAGYFFSTYFPKEKKRYFIIDKIIILICTIFFFFAAFTSLIVEKTENLPWGVNVVGGKGFFLFNIVVVALTILIFWNLFKKFFQSSQGEKMKIQYLLIGALIFGILNIIFNVFFPIILNTFKYDWIGDYSIIFFLSFTAYAIVKQNLFGIRVVLTQLLVAAIAIILFVQILASNSTFEYIWKSSLFLVFLFFGYLLIKSVVREIRLREELERAYVELERLDKAKSEFISIASHQLRTPLTAIKGYISMMIEGSYGKINEKMKDKLMNVAESAERLIRLINDLLSISRIESGKLELNFQKNNFEKLMKDVVDILEVEAQHKKLFVKWEKPKNLLPEIFLDEDKIKDVIINIVDNAIKYTQKGGITIKTRANNSSLLIEIIDSGAGMSSEEMTKLFKSFSRGSAGNQNYTEGAGLGLYIAKKFVEMHNGKIWVESGGQGKGSKFSVELPLSQAIKMEQFLERF